MDDPVFVLCAGRSGSTLVRFLLDAHPDLACPAETRLPWLATQLATAWSVVEGGPVPDGPGAGGPRPDDAGATAGGQQPAEPDPVIAGLRQSLNPLLAAYLRRASKKRYCDKSLGGAQHAPLLLRIWPEAKFICLYRHPMDVIGSGIEASPWGVSGYGFDNYVAGSPGNSVAALARYWVDYTASIVRAEQQLAGRCLRLRYEDLVADPEAQAGRLYAFIGVPPVPGIAVSCFDAGRPRSGPGDYKIWYTTGISTDSVGRGWAVPSRRIPPAVLESVNDLAAQLGYQTVGPAWGTGSKPADLRARPRPAGATAGSSAAARTLADRIAGRLRSGLSRAGAAPGWPPPAAAGSVLLFATADGPGDADTWWRLDLSTGTVESGCGPRQADADWSVTGSARAWQQVLAGEVSYSLAAHRGELRYAGAGDPGQDPGPDTADDRLAVLAALLDIAGTRPAGTAGPH